MSTYTYNGTNSGDYISTYDLQREYSWVTSGFDVNGLSGDDNLTSSFIGRNGVDAIDGGDGNDFMAISPSYLSPLAITNHAIFYGGFGSDNVYLTGNNSTSEFSINENNQIQFTVYGASGEVTEVSVGPTVEYITLGSSYYLTEDIWNGRIRAVDFSEVYARAYDENSDWYVLGLDTYSEYHNAPNPVPAPIPTPVPTPEPTPEPIPEVASETTYEWGKHSINENNFIQASVAPGGFYDVSFEVSGAQKVYTYFNLYDFSDDLDINLFKYNPTLGNYESIASSKQEGNEQETLFKGLTPGDYILEVSHYEDLDGSNTNSNFSVGFDSVSYYENVVIPDDTLFPSQWHLINTGQAGGIDNEDIMAPEAWSYRTNASEIIVGVIDGGIQNDHPDLEENIWQNSDEVFGNGIDDDRNGYIDDLIGWNFVANSPYIVPDDHGTHVAGTIGAKGNNSRGVAGIAWDIQLMSLDVFSGNAGASDQDIVEAIYYAVNNGAHVINMSLGYTFAYSTIDQWRLADPNGYANYYEALRYAVDNDCTVVIAAGNEDLNASIHLSIPAAFSSILDGVISTAAVTNTGDLSWYTNYGTSVTIASPGGNGSVVEGSGILSTLTNSTYGDLSGTSMASPIVAGAAALIKAVNNNFTPADIEEILTQSAIKYREISSLVQDGNYLDLNSALTLAQTYEASGATPTPTQTPNLDPNSTPAPTPTPDPYDGIIKSVRGKGKLKGTNLADIFTFDNIDVFTQYAADRIIGFNSKQGDSIAVSSNAFPSLKGASRLKYVSTKKKKELKKLSKKGYDFVYFEKKGRLYFDGNGTAKNWGSTDEGGLVAILQGNPDLTKSEFILLA